MPVSSSYVPTKPNPNINCRNFLKFLELIGKVWKKSTNCDCAYCPSHYLKQIPTINIKLSFKIRCYIYFETNS